MAQRKTSRVLVIGDTHCPGMLECYPSFLKRVYREFKCTRVVHIGDMVDNAAISYHEKNPELPSAGEEFATALTQVAKLYALFPRADWMVGNHDALSHRQAVTSGIPEAFLAPLNEVWHVQNWKVHPRYSRLVIDGVVYAHGDIGQGGMYNSVKNGRTNFTSWVCGHVHSEGGVWFSKTENSTIFGMNTGCGVDSDKLAFSYGRRYTRKPVLGCGVVIGGKEAYFIPLS
jgi:predicted phosphodiesterase